MDNREKAIKTYELLQERKRRRLKGQQDAVNFMFEQFNKSNKAKSKIRKKKYRGR